MNRTGSDLPRNQILVGDATQRLKTLPAQSVDMVLTSPPYFRLRNYQVDGQLGMEAHVDDWVHELTEVCAQVARVLVPSGSLWLNLGDTYSNHVSSGAARKSLLLGPERLALALVGDGWILRNKIVWAKTNPMPSPVQDRLSCIWEVIYLLTRDRISHFDLDSIRVPHRTMPSRRRPAGRMAAVPVPEAWRGPNSDGSSGLVKLKAEGRVGHPLGKNPGDVWQLPTAGYRGAHHAVMPLALAERAITAGCPKRRCTSCRTAWRQSVISSIGEVATRDALRPGCQCKGPSEPGLMLDPFMGAGTTALAAEKLGRDWMGVELNAEFAAQAGRRIAAGKPAAKQMTNERAA